MSFIVFRSSAGSGKTYTLVRYFVKLAIKSEDPSYLKHILAITFTNKATNEMKERIIRVLRDMSAEISDDENLLIWLSEELRITATDVKMRCRALLSYILHHYSDFQVSTIDRFFYQLIKSFAFELNLPGNIDVELNTDKLIERSVDDLLNELSSKPELTDILIKFSLHKYNEGKNYRLESELIELSKELTGRKRDKFRQSVKKFDLEKFSETRKSLLQSLKKADAEIQNLIQDIESLLNSNGIEQSDLKGGSRGLQSFLHSQKDAWWKEKKSNTSVEKALVEGDWKASKLNSERADRVNAISDQLSRKVSDFLELRDSLLPLYVFNRLVLQGIYALALVHEIIDEFEDYKRESSVAQLDDFNSLLSKLVMSQPIPFVYERLGEKIHHFLIDEFQDTSQVQWFNLIPLLENSLSTAQTSLLVGDAKQAIYRWRGGESEQLVQLPELGFNDLELPDKEYRNEAFKSSYTPAQLNQNWRSSPIIVDFVNEFFSQLSNKYPVIKDIYEGGEQIAMNNEESGSVEVNFLGKEENRFEIVLNRIKGFKEAGHEFNEMAILCRTKKQCSDINQFLHENEIPCLSTESLKLGESHEVLFLINWLKNQHEPGEREHVYKITEHLIELDKAVEKRDSINENWKNDKSLNTCLKEAGYPETIEYFEDFSLLEFIKIIAQRYLRDKTTDAYVANFMDHLLRFQSRYGSNLEDFLSWWEEEGQFKDIELSDSGNAVNIMTLHKAKGLEFGCVILPFAYDDIKLSESYFWIETRGKDKELLPITCLPADQKLELTDYASEYYEEWNKSFIDTVNLLYVGLTRAVNHLVVLSKQIGSTEKIREDTLLKEAFNLGFKNESELESIFKYGKIKQVVKSDVLEKDSELMLSSGSAGEWREKLSLKFRSEESIVSEAKVSAINYGNIAHEVMSSVQNLEDLEESIERIERQYDLDEEIAGKLVEDLKSSINQPEIQSYFKNSDYQVLTERTIIAKNGEVIRPDRMMISGQKAVVIDYKSGSPDLSHEQQVNTYMNHLKDLGFKDVEGYLIYLSTRQVEKVG